MIRRLRLVLALLLATSALACTGNISITGNDEAGETSEPTAEAEDGNDEVIVDPRTVECTEGSEPGPAPLRRMTEREFNNTIRDVFPAVDFPTYQFGPEETVGTFKANTIAAVGELGVESYRDAAQDIAERVRSEPAAFVCSEETVSEECAHATIDHYAPMIFRRPLAELDLTVWHTLLDASLAQGYGRRQSTAFTLEGMLQSPRFLYRAEASARAEAADGAVALDDYEMASRLSYFVAGTIPDDELMEAAGRGDLTGANASAELERHARRLLEKPSTRANLTASMQEWLGLGNIAQGLSDTVDPDLAASMEREVVAFLDHILWEEGGSIETLLKANFTFVDQRLADFYGIEFPEGAAEGEMVKVELDGTERIGVLTLPGVLATHASGPASIFRGIFISDTFLCTPVAERPDQAVIDAAVAADDSLSYEPGEAERKVARARIEHPSCAGCHQSMESVGLVFDNFAPDGTWRSIDDYGNELSDEGEIFRTQNTNGPVDGVFELADTLARSPDIEVCATQNWFRYVFARGLQARDACTTKAMLDALVVSNGDIREMLVAVVKTDAFRQRTAD